MLEQDPAAGGQVDRGSAVNLVVASAPARGRGAGRARPAGGRGALHLEDAGFEVRVSDQTVTDAADDGVVLEQAPDGGEERPDGSTIRITVGRFEEATPTATATPTPGP